NRPHCRAWGAATLGAALVILGIGHALAQAGNSIEGLTVSKGSSGRTVVKFTLRAPLANPPAGFAINNPPRIALDFPETGNGRGHARAARRRFPARQEWRRAYCRRIIGQHDRNRYPAAG